MIEATIPRFDPDFEEFFPPSAQLLVRRFLDACRNVLPQGRLAESAVDEYFSLQEDLLREPMRPGVGPFLVALGRLVESAGERGIDGDQVLQMFSACYESIVMANVAGRESIDKELASPACRGSIEAQGEILLRLVRQPPFEILPLGWGGREAATA
ncbi:hypothetical protein [Micromonospora gifhornensis]|uniref:hypothetical protein n=1 Tax=Micromonospora gifhornensis TaxID=84594 RepID=UPI00364D7CDE